MNNVVSFAEFKKRKELEDTITLTVEGVDPDFMDHEIEEIVKNLSALLSWSSEEEIDIP